MSTFIRMESGKNRRASLELRLVSHPLGRAVLHLAAFCRSHRNIAWHWAGVVRELRRIWLPPRC